MGWPSRTRGRSGLVWPAGCVVAISLGACTTGSTPELPDAGFADTAATVDAPQPPTLEGLSSLAVLPEDAVARIQGAEPASVRFVAIGTFEDGSERDVSDAVTWTVADPALGSFRGALFTSGLAPGRTTVRASDDAGIEASASIALFWTDGEAVVPPGVPADAPQRFADATPGGVAPELVYPADGVLVPPSLAPLEVQFRADPAHELFEVAFRGEASTIRLYARCTPVGAGCSVVPDDESWRIITTDNAGRAPIELEVRALGSTTPATVSSSGSRELGIAEEPMSGGIYYWAATWGSSGEIRRFDFGRSTRSSEPFFSDADAGGQCVGCHTLSPSGRRIAVGIGAPAPLAGMQVLDVASTALSWSLDAPWSGRGSAFEAFSPDETELVTAAFGAVPPSDVNLYLRDAATGAYLPPTLLVGMATMPAFAPDGSGLVFARPAECTPAALCTTSISRGSLWRLPRDASGWGTEQLLVDQSGTENNYYPDVSPDSGWVVYNHSGASSSYDAPDAALRAVPISGGTPVALAAADGGFGNSWPKWSPFVQAHRGGDLMWVTFTSRRAFGLHTTGGEIAQLWMAAFDPARAAAGEDPSYAAFRLPFQDLSTGNHIAQWVADVVRRPCTSDGDCEASEACEDLRCVPTVF